MTPDNYGYNFAANSFYKLSISYTTASSGDDGSCTNYEWGFTIAPLVAYN